ncbi:MAG: hypothetical protein M3367_18555 [Acidobacteriota bacterium]|nr:hypothetical protein [Acidobacteriota bacterium]
MKKRVETKQDGKEFTRFEEFVREIVRVPKKEINEREKAEKQKKEARKARKS